MKSINKIAVAAALAVCGASMASAATTYHVTGSTAYRVADVTAEVAYLHTTGTVYATYYGSSLTSANYSVVQNSQTTPTIVFQNFFNGSIAGDEALVDGKTQLAYPNSTDYTPGLVTPGTLTPLAAATGGTPVSASTYNTTNAYPDIAFSDVTFDTAQQIIKASTDHTNTVPANGTTGAIVGIVPFVFVYNASSDVVTALKAENSGSLPTLNMDPQKFTNTWGSQGNMLLSFFTGQNADEGYVVYPLGRDVDSGTRGTALAETGYGLAGSGVVTSQVYQYYPYDTAAHATSDSLTGVVGVDPALTNPTIGGLNFVPAESIDGYPMSKGDGGYYSGGNLATGVSTQFSGVSSTVVMTYLGVSDANSALGTTATNRQAAHLMSYNGSTFVTTATSAANSSLIYEGNYTFWGYEHLFYNSLQTGTSSIVSSLTTQLTSGYDQLSSNGVTYGDMNVGRSDDGQNVQ